MYRLVLDDRREMIMADGQMTYEDWLRGCVHHDGRNGYVTLPCDEVLKIADFIEKLRADRKEMSDGKRNKHRR